jgi:hypothetical protein
MWVLPETGAAISCCLGWAPCIGEGSVAEFFQIWGPRPEVGRPRGGAENPEGLGYGAFSHLKYIDFFAPPYLFLWPLFTLP